MTLSNTAYWKRGVSWAPKRKHPTHTDFCVPRARTLSLPQPAPSRCSAITDVQKLPGYTLHHAPQAQLPSLHSQQPSLCFRSAAITFWFIHNQRLSGFSFTEHFDCRTPHSGCFWLHCNRHTGWGSTYKGPSGSSSLIWTRELLSSKSGLVKACGAFLPLLSLLGILLCFHWMRGPWGRRAGSGPLTHPSVFPVSVMGKKGGGNSIWINHSAVTCWLINYFISPPSVQCFPFPAMKSHSNSSTSAVTCRSSRGPKASLTWFCCF